MSKLCGFKYIMPKLFMRTTVTIEDALYKQALEMADPSMDKSELCREAVKTFVRKQASALPRSAAQCLRFRMSRVAVKRRKHRSRNESAHRHFRVDRSLPKRQ